MVKDFRVIAILIAFLNIAFSQTIIIPFTQKTGYVGDTLFFEFSINTDNQTCSVSYDYDTTALDVYAPRNITGNFSGFIAVKLKKEGNYSITLSYCNAVFSLSVTSLLNVTQPQQQCPHYLKIYGKLNPGKTISFDIRDQNYQRVRSQDAIISIRDEEGNVYSVDCPTGFCSYLIPEDAQGTLTIELEMPNCNPIVQEVELKPLGEIQISVPSKVRYGEAFYIYVFDVTKGALKYAKVTVFYPSGKVLNLKTNENGIVMDEPLSKTFGKDIYPDETGLYKISVSYPGYKVKEASFEIQKGSCPYECCRGETFYEDKECASGYYCENRVCKVIQKPILEIYCNPAPTLGETSTCYLYSNGTLVNIDATGEMEYAGEKIQLMFKNGETTIEWDKVGAFSIKVSHPSYQEAVYSGKIEGTGIPIYAIVIAIIVIALLAALILSRRKPEVPKKTKKVVIIPAKTEEV